MPKFQIEEGDVKARMQLFESTLLEVQESIGLVLNPTNGHSELWNFNYLEPHYRMLKYYASRLTTELSVEQIAELAAVTQQFESITSLYGLYGHKHSEQ